jgi:hypothetical protein
MDARTRFEIDVSAPRPTVVIDGEDVAGRIQGFRLDAGVKGTVLTLFGAADGTIVGEGLVQVAIESDPQDAIATFLRSVSPKMLEDTALARLKPGDNLTQVMLDQLADWASGG